MNAFTTKIPKKYKIRYKGQTNDHCQECNKPHAQHHHATFGKNRRIWSDYYDLVYPLCTDCHDRLHRHGGELREKYEKLAQTEYEKYNTREQFIQNFGRNYL